MSFCYSSKKSTKLDKKEWCKRKYKKTLTNVFDLSVCLVSTLL